MNEQSIFKPLSNSGDSNGLMSLSPLLYVSPAATSSGYTSVTETLTGAVFTDGTVLSGTWTTEYDAAGKIVGITDDKFTATGPGGVTSFNGAYVLPYADPSASNSYEMTFGGPTSGGEYNSLYVDWVGEHPTSLDSGDQSLYTSIKDGAASDQPIRLETTGDVTCFTANTLIATPEGEVAIANLTAGDIVLLSDGGTAAIRWIGRKAVSPRFMDPLKVLPIRIEAGALEDTMPVRDLLVSPCHALLVDGVLIQAGALVNGQSIRRETAMSESFTYYHLELATHSLVIAEGVPAETFVDNAGRLSFDNWAEYEALEGNGEMIEMPYPRAKSARQVPTATRARLAARARADEAIAA